MSNVTLKFFARILLVCILAVALFFGAAVVSKVVRAADAPPLVEDVGPPVQNRTPPMKCGTYVFMEADLFRHGFVMLGSGIVNAELDRWVLFQQMEGNDPLLWIILIYINEEYQGLTAGSACEIIVGQAWVRVE
tara:strand:+ start:708 stop:1109 length:402 start_codon:yes stop_codon:yes gene_type:complete